MFWYWKPSSYLIQKCCEGRQVFTSLHICLVAYSDTCSVKLPQQGGHGKSVSKGGHGKKKVLQLIISCRQPEHLWVLHFTFSIPHDVHFTTALNLLHPHHKHLSDNLISLFQCILDAFLPFKEVPWQRVAVGKMFLSSTEVPHITWGLGP